MEETKESATVGNDSTDALLQLVGDESIATPGRARRNETASPNGAVPAESLQKEAVSQGQTLTVVSWVSGCDTANTYKILCYTRPIYTLCRSSQEMHGYSFS